MGIYKLRNLAAEFRHYCGLPGGTWNFCFGRNARTRILRYCATAMWNLRRFRDTFGTVISGFWVRLKVSTDSWNYLGYTAIGGDIGFDHFSAKDG